MTVPEQYRPAHETAYFSRVVLFTAACPSCGEDCPWTSTQHGSTPNCWCDESTGHAAARPVSSSLSETGRAS